MYAISFWTYVVYLRSKQKTNRTDSFPTVSGMSHQVTHNRYIYIYHNEKSNVEKKNGFADAAAATSAWWTSAVGATTVFVSYRVAVSAHRAHHHGVLRQVVERRRFRSCVQRNHTSYYSLSKTDVGADWSRRPSWLIIYPGFGPRKREIPSGASGSTTTEAVETNTWGVGWCVGWNDSRNRFVDGAL